MGLRHIFELFELMLPFPLSTGDYLLSDLSEKSVCELVEAPVLDERLLTTIQADQQEIRQHGQRVRARHLLFVVRHVPLAQRQPTLACLSGDLHTPPPRVQSQHWPCVGCCELGSR